MRDFIKRLRVALKSAMDVEPALSATTKKLTMHLDGNTFEV